MDRNPRDQDEWKNLILKTAREVEELKRAVGNLQSDENGRTPEGWGKWRAKIEAKVSELWDPYRKRMDDAQIKKYIVNTVRTELAKPKDTPD